MKVRLVFGNLNEQVDHAKASGGGLVRQIDVAPWNPPTPTPTLPSPPPRYVPAYGAEGTPLELLLQPLDFLSHPQAMYSWQACLPLTQVITFT